MSLLMLAGGLACYIGGLQDWKRVDDEREVPGFEVKLTTGETPVPREKEVSSEQ